MQNKYFLYKKGHNVTVYEKRKYAGGLLRYGIPDFKLEKNIIERRIDILKASFSITDFSSCLIITGIFSIFLVQAFSHLNKKYDATVLAIGTPEPRDLQIKGRKLKNIYFALDFNN